MSFAAEAARASAGRFKRLPQQFRVFVHAGRHSTERWFVDGLPGHGVRKRRSSKHSVTPPPRPYAHPAPLSASKTHITSSTSQLEKYAAILGYNLFAPV
jgi:hypothetical protein